MKELKNLYRLGFSDDSDDYTEYFFSRKAVGARVFVLFENGTVFSFVYGAEESQKVSRANGRILSAAYVFLRTLKICGAEVELPFIVAATTLPEYRGKKLFHKVVKEIFERYKNSPFIALYPFKHAYYGVNFGFTNYNYLPRRDILGGGGFTLGKAGFDNGSVSKGIRFDGRSKDENGGFIPLKNTGFGDGSATFENAGSGGIPASAENGKTGSFAPSKKTESCANFAFAERDKVGGSELSVNDKRRLLADIYSAYAKNFDSYIVRDEKYFEVKIEECYADGGGVRFIYGCADGICGCAENTDCRKTENVRESGDDNRLAGYVFFDRFGNAEEYCFINGGRGNFFQENGTSRERENNVQENGGCGETDGLTQENGLNGKSKSGLQENREKRKNESPILRNRINAEDEEYIRKIENFSEVKPAMMIRILNAEKALSLVLSASYTPFSLRIEDGFAMENNRIYNAGKGGAVGNSRSRNARSEGGISGNNAEKNDGIAAEKEMRGAVISLGISDLANVIFDRKEAEKYKAVFPFIREITAFSLEKY
ncbi:MAG: GNAT family N-acetyltransferase [Clostridiales bacterium]|jgi:hypothetical protein|nr:GNAT family N-acetyltransferase [Clostridiales bacterium]